MGTRVTFDSTAAWPAGRIWAVVSALSFLPTALTSAQGVWTPTSTVGAPAARTAFAAVWTGSRMIVWGGSLDAFASSSTDTGGVYDAGSRVWVPTHGDGAPVAREGAAAVWTGSRMIVWGGYRKPDFLNSGGIYDPATDTWTPTSTAGAPTPRASHTAVWTGSRMVVWGGVDDPSALNTGGVYDPATDTWTPVSALGAPSRRWAHTAVWTGSRMIVWGEENGGSFISHQGGVYDPATDTWTPMSNVGAPAASEWGHHQAVWTGSRMIVWGGGFLLGRSNAGGTYDPATDTWMPTSTAGAPTPRFGNSAVWTGSNMIVWGGESDDGSGFAPVDTGGVYNPATDTWAPTHTLGAPTSRRGHSAPWTGSAMIVWAGADNGGHLNTGGIYFDPALLPPGNFFTMTPCRVADTRNAVDPLGGPILGANSTRSLPVTGGVCGIPPTAIAVSVNLTAVGAAAAGHLTLFPGDAAGPPLVSNINFSPGLTRANNAIVLLAADGTGTIKVNNGSVGAVHFVLDVNGYFQ